MKKIGIINEEGVDKIVTTNGALASVVDSAELVACDDQGTPIIGEDGKKICNCSEPMQSHFPNNKYYCLKCWGEWYH
jgi:hypothetical protein